MPPKRSGTEAALTWAGRGDAPAATGSFHLPPLNLPGRRPRAQAARALQVPHRRPIRRAWPRGEAIQRRDRAVSSHRLVERRPSATRPQCPSGDAGGTHLPSIGYARFPERAIAPEGISHLPFPSQRRFNLRVAMRLAAFRLRAAYRYPARR
jgi:hypothetical protein